MRFVFLFLPKHPPRLVFWRRAAGPYFSNLVLFPELLAFHRVKQKVLRTVAASAALFQNRSFSSRMHLDVIRGIVHIATGHQPGRLWRLMPSNFTKGILGFSTTRDSSTGTARHTGWTRGFVDMRGSVHERYTIAAAGSVVRACGRVVAVSCGDGHGSCLYGSCWCQ